jgi:hypothetical protein
MDRDREFDTWWDSKFEHTPMIGEGWAREGWNAAWEFLQSTGSLTPAAPDAVLADICDNCTSRGTADCLADCPLWPPRR